MPLVTVPKVLREKLGDDGAEALVDLLNVTNGQTKADVLTFVEEKFECRLSEEMSKVSVEFARVRQELATEVGRLNASISEAKAELIRWMFIFWIGQIGALLGILFAFFRK